MVRGLAVIVLPGPGEGLGPFGMVDGVRVELGLQAVAAPAAVAYTVLAGLALEEITGVELETAAVGADSHAPAGFRICNDGTGGGKYLKVVVIAMLQMQSIVILSDIPANGLGNPEIKGRAFHTAILTGGDGFGVGHGEETAGDGHDLIHSLLGMLVTGQVEVGMVGQVKHSILIGYSIIGNVQSAVAFQSVGDPDGGIAGEALVAVGAKKAHANGIFLMVDDPPDPVLIGFKAAVQIVLATIVLVQNVMTTVEGETGMAHTVGVSAHHGTGVGAAFNIVLRIIKAQNHVGDLAGAVRNQELYNGSPQITDDCCQTAAGDGIQVSLLATGQNAKNFFHNVYAFRIYLLPFHF